MDNPTVNAPQVEMVLAGQLARASIDHSIIQADGAYVNLIGRGKIKIALPIACRSFQRPDVHRLSFGDQHSISKQGFSVFVVGNMGACKFSVVNLVDVDYFAPAHEIPLCKKFRKPEKVVHRLSEKRLCFTEINFANSKINFLR